MASPEMIHDLIIVGGGPAGLCAAMNAGSERIKTIVLDAGSKIGGQAGTATEIVNYPGFVHGISGAELMANIVDQALRFNIDFMGPTRAVAIERNDDGILVVRTDDSDKYYARTALLSMGVETRLLKARNIAAYRGRGVNYGPPSSTKDYQDKRVFIVGGGNSAGQAAYKLAEFDACDVHLLIRGDSIEEHMSGYLVDRINSKENITIHTNTDLTGVDGNKSLESVSVNHTHNGPSQMKADEVFVFIGSEPKTDWLPEGIVRDDQKFVCAGSALSNDARGAFIEQTRGRNPYDHETSMHTVFVAGDVRSGTNKRVAGAVGDGSGVVPEIHNLRAYRSKR